MERTLYVGNVHGCLDELRELLDRAALSSDDTLVCVGDVVDRGPDPAGVLALVRARPRTVVLMGNHERKHVRGVFSYSQEITRLQLGDGYADAVAWMATLPYSHETPQARAVHYGHFPGTPLSEVPEDVLAGTTSGERRLRERYGDASWYDAYDDDAPIIGRRRDDGGRAPCCGRRRGRR